MSDSAEVALTDLEVIQQFSLAVRGATAPREAVIAALESDLAYLTGGRGRSAGKAGRAPEKAPERAAAKAPAKRAPAKRAARRA